MKQPQFSPLQVEEQVCVIFAGTQGYLDKIAKNKVQEFEAEFLRKLHADHGDILTAIRTSGKLEKDVEDKLRAALDAFAKNFA
jgi:F-type H+-transporting ATPase subunit alpha